VTPPGRAQPAPPGRFAFADTTLLRDTLGLHFDHLFPLADSLSLPPDTLRALSVRYRYSLARLIKLADSLGMPVDSVGAVLLRERLNPLARSQRSRNSFEYSSSYNVAQTSSSWINSSNYNLVLGSVFVGNNTSITMDRYRAGGRTSLRQTRSSSTETGWKFSPNFSVGGRANLARFDTRDPGSPSNEGETKGEFQVSMRSRQQPAKGLSSEINFFSGLLDLVNASQEKRGASGDLSGRIRYLRGSWLTHDVSGQLTGNLARTRDPNQLLATNTQDFSSNLRGTLGMFASRPIALNLNYALRNARVETPGTTGLIQQVRTNNNSVDAALRLRQGNERSLNFTQRLGTNRQATASALNSQSTREDNGFTVSGRYGYRGLSLEGNFGRTRGTSSYPRRVSTGGYGERQDARSIDATLIWTASRRLSLKANGSVGLTALRYFVLGTYTSPLVPRDSYRQSYRVDGLYTRSERVNTGVVLEVGRTLFVNIPATSTSANTDARSYRAEWRWSYRLLKGLTASQRNQLTAEYVYYTFLPASNDRLSLDYTTLTTLNAVITQHLLLDLNHSTRFQPSGNFAPLDPPFDDGLAYFKRADDNSSNSLRARLAYTPAPSLSLNISPEYLESDRRSTSNGIVVPQRETRSLHVSGGASLNFDVGRSGRLTGDIARNFRADRTINFTAGVPRLTPRSESDFWNGSLQLTWRL